jgi:hypothetical protein
MSLRTGGREAVEDTPVTGARTWDWLCDYCEAAIDEESDAATRLEMRVLLDSARAVLNGGVRADDALTTEDRAAIARLVRSTAAGKLAQTLARAGQKCVAGSPLWEAAEEELAALDAITDDDVARFRAIAAGGTE